eukprot:scaffold8659_cov167-Skeletonema_marinoi.AAC.3
MTVADMGVNAGKSLLSQLRKNAITARHVYTSTQGCISFIRRCVTYSVIARKKGYCIEYAAYKMFNIIHPLLHSSNMHNAQCTSCNAQLEAIVSTDTSTSTQAKHEEYNTMLFYYFKAIVYVNK